MPNPIEWKEADRTETKTIPGASARLVVRRTREPGFLCDGTPRAVCRVDDATPADLASALDAVSEADREAIVKATGIVEALFEQLDAVRKQREQLCYESSGRLVERNAAQAERDEARRHLCNERNGAAGLRDALATMRKERDTARDQCAQVAAERDMLRTELRAREWLDAAQGCASRPVFVQANGVAFTYASYAGAARALGWEG